MNGTTYTCPKCGGYASGCVLDRPCFGCRLLADDGKLSLDNLDAQFCSDWLKDQIRGLFAEAAGHLRHARMSEDLLRHEIKENEKLRAEVAVARERLGPAGYRILQEVIRLREGLAEIQACTVCSAHHRLQARNLTTPKEPR